jgi:hypothetical protein
MHKLVHATFRHYAPVDISEMLIEAMADLSSRLRGGLPNSRTPTTHLAERISRDMAEVAAKGRRFAEDFVPLFLQVPRDNPAAVAQVALAMKVQLEELTDALLELRQELPEWAEFFSELVRR